MYPHAGKYTDTFGWKYRLISLICGFYDCDTWPTTYGMYVGSILGGPALCLHCQCLDFEYNMFNNGALLLRCCIYEIWVTYFVLYFAPSEILNWIDKLSKKKKWKCTCNKKKMVLWQIHPEWPILNAYFNRKMLIGCKKNANWI